MIYLDHSQNLAARWRAGCLHVPLLLPVLLAVAGVLVACPSQAQLTYTTNNGTIRITGYTSTGDEVVIPSTIDGLPVTSIGTNAFQQASMYTVSIPNTVTSIEDGAFYRCFYLTDVTIPKSVTSIGSWAFSGSGLTNVTIPSSVTRIGDHVFSDTWHLTAITVDSANQSYSSIGGVFFDKGQTTLIQYPQAKSGAYIIPESVSSIANQAFYSCQSLTNVTIPNGVTSIGDSAFFFCYSLTNVTIPGSVTSIGDSAFSQCYGLTNVTISNGVTSIGDGAFSQCSSLTIATIPRSVISIGNGAFSDCPSLANIMVDPVNSAFSSVAGVLFNQSQTTLVECPSGTVVGRYTIPNSVISVGKQAFSDCHSLTGVAIPNSVTSIEDEAFSGSGLTSVTIPNSVTSIGNSAFYSCQSLSNVAIPNSVTTIEDGVFSGSGLTSVSIPNSVTSIGGGAFEDCWSLTDVTIPNSVTNIGNYAFDYCTSLINVTIPNSVTSVGRGAFRECISLTAINVETNNPAYTSVNGALFDQGQTTLIQYPGGKVGSYSIPNSVTSIPDEAFLDCTGLINVTIGNRVTSIGGGAFDDCLNLTNVTIPNSVTSIGDGAFFNCDGLPTVTIPNSVTSIGQYAFTGCTALTNLYFQGNAPSLGEFVFGGYSFQYEIDRATAYYLPGTSGWGSYFGGIPTALWTLPYPLINNIVGVGSNQFGFTVSWATNLFIVVEAATDLANPVWFPLVGNALSGGIFYFTDSQLTNYPSRFYRVRSQ